METVTKGGTPSSSRSIENPSEDDFRSVRAGRDDLAKGASRQGAIGLRLDTVLDKVDGTIAEQEVHASRVVAPVILDVGFGMVRGPRAVAQADGAENHRERLLGVRGKLVGPPFK